MIGVGPGFAESGLWGANLVLRPWLGAQAIEAVRPVLDLPVEQRNFGITISVQRVHAALHAAGRRNIGAVADLRGEIEAFTATPTSVLVR